MVVATPTRLRRPVEVVREVCFPADAVRAALEDDPVAVVSGLRPDGVIRIGVEISPRLRFEREIAVGFGPFIEEDDGTVNLVLWWEASHQPGLFPTFDGGLEVRPRSAGAELRLVGSYQLPLRRVGAFTNELLGARLARGSLEAFVDNIAASLAPRLSAGGSRADCR